MNAFPKIIPTGFFFLVMIHFLPVDLTAQQTNIQNKWLHGYWRARWIAHPVSPGTQFGVYHFRKAIHLSKKPASFVVHISADNRYRLFVNGRSVCTGPARSDLANWNFESVDLAPYLQAGKNIVAATVWNFAEYRPYSQQSFQTAFLLQGDTPEEEILNTNHSWKVVQDSAYAAFPIDKNKLHAYIVVAEGEQVDAAHYIWGFEQAGFDDHSWPEAMELWYAAKSRSFGTDGNWQLVPRSIPLSEEKEQRFAFLVEKEGTRLENGFFSGNQPLKIAAHQKQTLILDQSHLTNAYPVLVASGGKDAVITFTYAEAAMDSNGTKGNRDSIEGKKILGLQDRFVMDGGMKRVYSPLHFRTFRYLKLDIETGEESLQLDDMYSTFTGYPFSEKASFESSDRSLKKIWETGWRTARLCAVDTYFDCPYYEQLQYVGDTRIQALISLYVSGDDRLMRKAIDDISHSFIPDGLTQSRYPSRDLQVIPTFSLWWVCMIHDYWMHRQDDYFVKSHLDGIENVLRWYQYKIAGNGMLGSLSWWQFVDWSWPWADSIRVGGVPPGVSRGGSSIVTLQFAYTLRRAAQLMEKYGRPEKAMAYRQLADRLVKETYRLCWDASRGMLADTYEKKDFSQHANILAVLTDVLPAASQPGLLDKILKDSTITQATYYFRFYLFEALKKAGMGNRFLELLRPWYDMLDLGLTTFAENPEPTRSDCHAWSASPNYELLSLVCGVVPEEPGFRKVKIEPFPGKLQDIRGRIPHPSGEIIVELKQNGVKHSARIILPPGINGTFVWKGMKKNLVSGDQAFDF